MAIFEYENYQNYLKQRFENLPRKGYGQSKRLAEHLGVSTTYISQVIHADKVLNLDQAVQVSEYLGLTDLETEYFLKLVLLERAQTEKLKKMIKAELNKIRISTMKVSHKIKAAQVLPDEEKVIFYSDWYYSAIRLLTGIKGYQTIEAIVDYFRLPKKNVAAAVQFLVETGLCKYDKSGLVVGPSRTHLDSESPFIKLHHLHWRQKALENVKHMDDKNLHFSSPMTISRKDVEKIKSVILKMIEDVGKVVDSSESEELVCLNVDWFHVGPK